MSKPTADATDRPDVISRTGPRRSESARLAVLHAADDLLVERGFAGLTIEGIAQRAGVAKQTIYRWWKSKVDILLDTLADDARDALQWRIPEGDTAAEEDLKAHLRRVADFFQDPAGQVLQALVGHAQLDEKTAAALRSGFLREQRERDIAGLRALLTRSLHVTVGDQTAGRLVDLSFGPLYYRALVFGEPIDEEVVDATARAVLMLARESAA
ncbi:TetR family transcriptional regulator [Nocardiopsis gilva YIM 90087]|uniref:TetR family transcriptional regulator n=1 Tax=Nocardiopsis gilva YIM 90087 TaxID=1235441 RepID=A0A223RZZ7_9ACTN|nr:TetR/AcrR family transcriptional regulator [Nocardiopsis gilva]ASU81446.1 TetR family transcriptional regulator [Nocardiopsis gilva YIM 90087]